HRLPHRSARRTEVVLQSLRHPAARLPLLPQPRLPEVSRRADAGLARTASGGDVTGSLFPRHRHRARGTAGRAAPVSDRRLRRADEGRRRGDHRVGPRSALGRRHRRRAGRAAYLDATAHLPSARSLPGYRRPIVRSRHHLASRRQDLPLPQIGARHPRPLPRRLRQALPGRRPCAHVWQIPWVVDITPWGEGQHAALDYLARYAFRIAITNNRILAVDDESVTYRYKDRAADRQRNETVAGHEFIRRFLQHVLPAGFHKVRYYGLWHASRREPLRNLR